VKKVVKLKREIYLVAKIYNMWGASVEIDAGVIGFRRG